MTRAAWPTWAMDGPVASDTLLRQVAGWIGRRLEATGSPGADEPDPVQAVDLYSGPLGLAVFWAAMGRLDVWPRPEAERLRALCLAPTRERLALWSSRPPSADEPATGALCGAGAVVYAWTALGRIEDEPRRLEEAAEIAETLLTPERIAADRHYDLYWGNAGALAALLTLLEARRAAGLEDAGLLARAELCGQALVDHRSAPPGGRGERSWPYRGRYRTGFAHGASGIAHALLRLYGHTADRGWLTTALEALRFESSFLSEADGNWRLHEDDRRSPLAFTAWCQGASGMLLARLEALEHADEDWLRREARIALTTTLAAGQGIEDDLCCGNAGRAGIVEIWRRAVPGDDGRLREADAPSVVERFPEALLYRTLAKAKGHGDFVWTRSAPGLSWNPYLFQGAAGLGYAYLRLLAPDTLPSLLELR